LEPFVEPSCRFRADHGLEVANRRSSDHQFRYVHFQIADDRPVGLARPEGKIINAYNAELIALIGDTAANYSQRCIVAHWHPQTIRKGRCRSAAEHQTKVVHDGLQPLGAPTVT
jgi:hypothetical protein